MSDPSPNLEYIGAATNTTEGSRADEERQTRLWFLESIDLINRTIRGTEDLEQMMSHVLDAVVSIFECDRAWMVYPCDPESQTWRTVMERTSPGLSDSLFLGLDFTMDAEVAHMHRMVRDSETAARFGTGADNPIPGVIAARLTIQTQICLSSQIERDGNRAADVINSLRSFYKTGTSAERQLVDIKDIIGEMTVLLRTEAARHSVTIHADLGADVPDILSNQVQLQQVLMNLMLNAIEAMKDTGGEMTIRSRVNPEGQLMISISDTGIGLPAESSERIFEPFHTTKPQGTGMGLTITRSIVESWGGRVWATPNQAAGATFHFTISGESEAHS